MARSTEADDYPWAPPVEALLESGVELIAAPLGRGRDDRGRRAEPGRRPGGARVRRPAWSARAPAPGCSRRWPRCSSTSTSATWCRPSTSRRSSCTAAATGSSTSATGAGSPSTCRTRGWSSCPATTTSCGTRTRRTLIGEMQEFLTGTRYAPEPERILATVLFTDIVDSTRTAAELGDQRWREVLEGHQRGVRERARRASAAARSSRPATASWPRSTGPARGDPLRPGDRRLLRAARASRFAPGCTPASAR